MGDAELTVRFDDGRSEVLTGDELAAARLDHAYAVTVHRMQGATADRAHVYADSGGRELAYVTMSRARGTSHVYVVADDVDQGAEDLVAEWSSERRQRWVLDVDELASDDHPRRPTLARRIESTLRLARLQAEREAVQAVAPEADARLRSLDLQLRLELLAERPAPARGNGLGR